MEIEYQDSFGMLEHDVIIALSRDELHQLRLACSLAKFYLPQFSILEDFLVLTDRDCA
jgi:hypothetical protein